jgi:hypothetical protein
MLGIEPIFHVQFLEQKTSIGMTYMTIIEEIIKNYQIRLKFDFWNGRYDIVDFL